MWIYKITNTINGKVYVGKTNNLKRRIAEHWRGRHVGAIARAFKKHGRESFIFWILEIGVETEETLNALEAKWIHALHSHGSENGYNMTMGGDGSVFSDEMRAARSGARHWFYGGKHTEESCRKMSETRKGRYWGSENSKRIAADLAKNRVWTPEMRAKLSASKSGQKVPALSTSLRGKKKSAEHIASLRVAFRLRRATRLIDYQGETLPIAEWARRVGLCPVVLRYRLNKGWGVDLAMTKPAGRWK